MSVVRRDVESPLGGITEGPNLPPYVTFATGADLLVRLGVDSEATGDSIRYIARNNPEWPFGEEGEGKPHVYVHIGNARTMETGVFLAWHHEHPRTGRGRDKEPRRKDGRSHA